MRASHSAVRSGVHSMPCEFLDQPRRDVLGVADDRDQRGDVLADLRRVHVGVDDLRVRRERLELAGHAVVEARAEVDEQVALVHGVVGRDRAVHAEHAHGELVGLGERAERHERRGHRQPAQLRELEDLGGGVGGDGAPAQVEHGPLRLVDGLGRGADLLDVPLERRLVAGQVDRVGVVVGELAVGDVDRDVDDHRAGPAGGGDVERLVHGLRQLGRVS